MLKTEESHVESNVLKLNCQREFNKRLAAFPRLILFAKTSFKVWIKFCSEKSHIWLRDLANTEQRVPWVPHI